MLDAFGGKGCPSSATAIARPKTSTFCGSELDDVHDRAHNLTHVPANRLDGGPQISESLNRLSVKISRVRQA